MTSYLVLKVAMNESVNMSKDFLSMNSNEMILSVIIM